MRQTLCTKKVSYSHPFSPRQEKKLYLLVSAPLEALRDSHFLALTASYANIQAQKLKSTFEIFDPNTMMKAVLQQLSPQATEHPEETEAAQHNWKKIGRLAAKYSARSPATEHLFISSSAFSSFSSLHVVLSAILWCV